MATYNLNRYEKNKDKDGVITSIFIAVGITDDLGNGITQEHWLSSEEKDAVLLDETALTPILIEVAAEGEIRLESQIFNKPQPSEVADEAKKKSFFPNPTPAKIADKVVAIKQARADAKAAKEAEKLAEEEVIV